MIKDKKTDTLALIDNYNLYDRQTHKQTDGHDDYMTESEKIGPRVVNGRRKIFIHENKN